MQKLVNQINVYLQLFDTFYKVNFEESDSIKEHLHIIDLIEKGLFTIRQVPSGAYKPQL